MQQYCHARKDFMVVMTAIALLFGSDAMYLRGSVTFCPQVATKCGTYL